MVRIHSFFWVGARSKIHSALVLCTCVDNGSATAERRRCCGSFSFEACRKVSAQHFVCHAVRMKHSVWRLLLLRLVDACIAETV